MARMVLLMALAVPSVASAQALPCGATVSTNTTLTADVVCAPGYFGPALRVFPGVTLDGAGHTVFVGAGTGVRLVGVSDVVVRNLTVVSDSPSVGNGAVVSNTTRVTIEDCTFENLRFGLWSGPNTAQTDLVVRRVSVAGSGTTGMNLVGVRGASVIESNIFDDSKAGLTLKTSVGPLTIGGTNTFARVGRTSVDPVVFLDASSDVTLDGLDLSGSTGRAVQISSSPRTTVQNSNLSGRSRGIYAFGAALNTDLEIVNNDVSGATLYGMQLDSIDAGLVLEDNLFAGTDTALRLQDLVGPWSLSPTNDFGGAGLSATDPVVWLTDTTDVVIDGVDLSDTRGLGWGVYLENTTRTEIRNSDLSGRSTGIETVGAHPGLTITNVDVSGAASNGMRLFGVDPSLTLANNRFDFARNGLYLTGMTAPWTLPSTNSFLDAGTTSTSVALWLDTVSDVTVSGVDLSGSGVGDGIRLEDTARVTLSNNNVSGRTTAIDSLGINTSGVIRANDASGATGWSMWLQGWSGLDLGDNVHTGSVNGIALVGVTGPDTLDLYTSDLSNIGVGNNDRAVLVSASSDLTIRGPSVDMPDRGTAIEMLDSARITVQDMLACDTQRGTAVTSSDQVTLDGVLLDASLYGVEITSGSDGTALVGVSVGGPALGLLDLGSGTTGSPGVLADTDGDGLSDLCDPCPNDPDLSNQPPGCVDQDLCVGDDATGDADGDGYCADSDCDDNDPNAFPGNPEVCDGVDNNCIFGIDEGSGGGADSDGDGCTDCGDPMNDGPDADADGICDLTDTDADNDGVENTVDPAPLDCTVCGDEDLDLCDDCAVTGCVVGGIGFPNASDDGSDADLDGFCDASDFQVDTAAGVVLSSVGWSTGGIGAPSVIVDRVAGAPGPFLMAFETQIGTDPSCPRGVWAIGLATSPDGVNWTDVGAPLLQPTLPVASDYACVAAQPTIVQHDGGPDIAMFFKAEDQTGYRGIGSLVFRWNGSQYEVTEPFVNVWTSTTNFGHPRAVWDNGTYRVAFNQLLGAYTTSGTPSALGEPVLAFAKNFAPYGPDEAYNPAIACDANGDFQMFIGGRDLTRGVVTSLGIGRRPSDGTLSTFGPGPEPLISTTKGDIELRHWDVIRVGEDDYVMYFAEKATTGVPLVRMARTSQLTDYTALQDKACP